MPGNKASSMQRHEQFQAKQYRKNYRETTYNFTNHGITPSRGLAVLSLLCLAGMAVGPVMVRAQPSASLGPVLTPEAKSSGSQCLGLYANQTAVGQPQATLGSRLRAGASPAYGTNIFNPSTIQQPTSTSKKTKRKASKKSVPTVMSSLKRNNAIENMLFAVPHTNPETHSARMANQVILSFMLQRYQAPFKAGEAFTEFTEAERQLLGDRCDPFKIAVAVGNLGRAKHYIEQYAADGSLDAKINPKGDNVEPPLILASFNGDIPMMKLLLDAKADPTIEGKLKLYSNGASQEEAKNAVPQYYVTNKDNDGKEVTSRLDLDFRFIYSGPYNEVGNIRMIWDSEANNQYAALLYKSTPLAEAARGMHTEAVKLILQVNPKAALDWTKKETTPDFKFPAAFQSKFDREIIPLIMKAANDYIAKQELANRKKAEAMQRATNDKVVLGGAVLLLGGVFYMALKNRKKKNLKLKSTDNDHQVRAKLFPVKNKKTGTQKDKPSEPSSPAAPQLLNPEKPQSFVERVETFKKSLASLGIKSTDFKFVEDKKNKLHQGVAMLSNGNDRDTIEISLDGIRKKLRMYKSEFILHYFNNRFKVTSIDKSSNTTYCDLKTYTIEESQALFADLYEGNIKGISEEFSKIYQHYNRHFGLTSFDFDRDNNVFTFEALNYQQTLELQKAVGATFPKGMGCFIENTDKGIKIRVSCLKNKTDENGHIYKVMDLTTKFSELLELEKIIKVNLVEYKKNPPAAAPEEIAEEKSDLAEESAAPSIIPTLSIPVAANQSLASVSSSSSAALVTTSTPVITSESSSSLICVTLNIPAVSSSSSATPTEAKNDSTSNSSSSSATAKAISVPVVIASSSIESKEYIAAFDLEHAKEFNLQNSTSDHMGVVGQVKTTVTDEKGSKEITYNVLTWNLLNKLAYVVVDGKGFYTSPFEQTEAKDSYFTRKELQIKQILKMLTEDGIIDFAVFQEVDFLNNPKLRKMFVDGLPNDFYFHEVKKSNDQQPMLIVYNIKKFTISMQKSQPALYTEEEVENRSKHRGYLWSFQDEHNNLGVSICGVHAKFGEDAKNAMRVQEVAEEVLNQKRLLIVMGDFNGPVNDDLNPLFGTTLHDKQPVVFDGIRAEFRGKVEVVLGNNEGITRQGEKLFIVPRPDIEFNLTAKPESVPEQRFPQSLRLAG